MFTEIKTIPFVKQNTFNTHHTAMNSQILATSELRYDYVY